jgi:hypothetical protein
MTGVIVVQNGNLLLLLSPLLLSAYSCCYSYWHSCCYYSYWHCCSYHHCYSLAIPSPSWIPLYRYLRLMIQASGGPGQPRRGFTVNVGRPLSGATPPGDTNQVISPRFVPLGTLYLTPETLPPRSFPRTLSPLDLPPCALHTSGRCIKWLVHQSFRNTTSFLAGLRKWCVEPQIMPSSFAPSGLRYLGALPSGFRSKTLPPSPCLSLLWIPLDLHHLRLDHPVFRSIWTSPPPGVSHPRV